MEAIGTNEQVADVFTKGLNTTKFEEFRQQLGMTTRAELKEKVGVEGGVLKINTDYVGSGNFSILLYISLLLSRTFQSPLHNSRQWEARLV